MSQFTTCSHIGQWFKKAVRLLHNYILKLLSKKNYILKLQKFLFRNAVFMVNQSSYRNVPT
jgi:hypothetical protein